jgi:hypothetical protein
LRSRTNYLSASQIFLSSLLSLAISPDSFSVTVFKPNLIRLFLSVRVFQELFLIIYAVCRSEKSWEPTLTVQLASSSIQTCPLKVPGTRTFLSLDTDLSSLNLRYSKGNFLYKHSRKATPESAEPPLSLSHGRRPAFWLSLSI